MTISTPAEPLSYPGDDTATPLPITWSYDAKSHVVATLRASDGTESTWVLDTDYAITDAGENGTLTPTTGAATGETVVITSEPPNTQLTDIPLGGDFPAKSVEDALDVASQVSQKIEVLFDRALRVPKTDTRSGSQLELPNETDRASNFLGFDTNGDPVAIASAITETPVSTFAETYLDETTATATRAVLGAGTLDNVVEDTTPQLGGFLDPNSNYIGRAKGGDIASASPLVCDTDGDYFNVIGTEDFSAVTVAANRSGVFEFDGILTITVGSGITLNNAASNYTTAAGDKLIWQSTATDTITGFIIKVDGTAVVSAGITRGTEQATTSGTVKDFTVISSSTKIIDIPFNAVSTDGIQIIIVQIGDSGGFETSGYVSRSVGLASGVNPAIDSSTEGFAIYRNAANEELSGVLTLTNISGNIWVSKHVFHGANGRDVVGGGVKTLSGTLDSVRVTSESTPDDFDNGSVNIIEYAAN